MRKEAVASVMGLGMLLVERGPRRSRALSVPARPSLKCAELQR